jgi:hypothetical protein
MQHIPLSVASDFWKEEIKQRRLQAHGTRIRFAAFASASAQRLALRYSMIPKSCRLLGPRSCVKNKNSEQSRDSI